MVVRISGKAAITLHMRYFWIILNSLVVALGFRGGYVSMNSESLRGTNPDVVLCVIALVILPPFTVGCVTYSIRRWKADPLCRPSWVRNPFNWWGDPLQGLFVCTCMTFAMAIGSALRHPIFGSVGFWMLGLYCSSTVGLLVGQVLVYRIYRQRIASN